jgi:hypothetical protein
MLHYKSTEDDRCYSKSRREILKEAGQCIGGPLVGFVGKGGAVHGPVVRGGKCQRCITVHKGRAS